MEVNIDDNKIDVVIIYKNNKNIYFRIKEDLKLYVTCHRLVSQRKIKKLIMDNKQSILKMYNAMKKRQKYNNEFHYLGKKYNLKIDKTVSNVVIEDNIIKIKDQRMLDKFWQEECLRIFFQRVEELKKQFIDLPEFKIRIRFMKTRWGVCNKATKIITLNSELLKKDISLLDYVIIHELCHFKYPHHQKDFWTEVAKYYPDYKMARKKLKEV